MTTHCINVTWHNTSNRIAYDMTWHATSQLTTAHPTSPVASQPTTLLDLTSQATSWHQNRSHHHHGTAEGSFMAKKWFGHRSGRSPCTHSMGKFFFARCTVLFPSWNFRPGSPGNYLYVMRPTAPKFIVFFKEIALRKTPPRHIPRVHFPCVFSSKMCLGFTSHCQSHVMRPTAPCFLIFFQGQRASQGGILAVSAVANFHSRPRQEECQMLTKEHFM